MSNLTPVPQPDVQLLFNEACAHFHAGRLREAEAMGELILENDPEHADVLHLLGVILSQTKRADIAVKLVLRAAQIKPDNADYPNTLGNILATNGHFAEAIACYQKAVALKPDYAGAYSNMGSVLKDTGRLAEAVSCYELAAKLEPDLPHPYNNLGVALLESGRIGEAIRSYQHAIARQADLVEAHHNLGCALLLAGDWTNGLPEYEWRTKLPRYAPRRALRQPYWDGAIKEGATLFIHTEQGVGDTLNFLRYVPHAAARVGRVVVECQPALKRLLQGWGGSHQLIAEGENLAACDLQCHLLSLPYLLQLDEIPIHLPYYRAPLEDAAKWRERVAQASPGKNLKVGLAWQGNPAHRNDRNRSMPLAALAPLAQIPDVTYFSLQKGPGSEQIASAEIKLVDLTSDVNDFADTTALISQLDLVITVDTSVAHLAGGMGTPVWTMLPWVPDWRWGIGAEATPWYQSMRLFRQPNFADWSPVVQKIAAELAVCKKA